MAAISLKAPFCIPGMTLRVAMDATPRTPHFTFLVIALRSPRAKSSFLGLQPD
jgi:hypothetical protein